MGPAPIAPSRRRPVGFDPTRRSALALGLLGAARVAVRPAGADTIIPPGFRDEVLALLREVFPDRSFAPDPANGAALTLGATRLFLGNLFQYVKDAPPPQRRADILRWFAQNLAILDKTAADTARMRVWANAKPQVRSQLVPRAYLAAKPDILYTNLSPNILAISVIDFPDRTAPIRTEQLASWGLAQSELRETALANLEAISREVPITLHDATDPLGPHAIVATGDAYDAARILLPGVRRRLAERLGATMFAAVPTRGMLMAWPQAGGQAGDHGRERAAKLATEAATRPYPLSSEIFVITADTIRLADVDDGPMHR